MKKKYTDEYKKKLTSKAKEISRHIQLKTGYEAKLTPVLEEDIGYVYQVKISLDGFNTYATLRINSLNKVKVLNDLKVQIPNLNFKDKRRTCYSKQAITNSTNLWCSYCEKELSCNSFHRNISEFPMRKGYSYICHDCANETAMKIYTESNPQTAILYLCALYQRPYVSKLVDKVVDMSISPIQQFGEYFRTVALQPIFNRKLAKKQCIFSSSDIFEFDENKNSRNKYFNQITVLY